ALCNGATLCLATREQSRPGPGLVSQLREQGVTDATLPPSVLSVLEPDELPRLRTVISVAEACPAGTVERWTAGGRRFLNGYGPTEASVGASVTGPLEVGRAVTIGRPLANVEIYLLDAQHEPVPIGVSGEIYIGGEGLARGYLNRPELTAERFIPHPFSRDEGARLYRTGDLGRYKAGGEIEYLGRADRQVKLRGYRIELGEVEAALRRHPSVKDAVVTAREDEANNKSLVAYCVLSDSHDSTVGETWRNELRHFLRESLPEYMVPSAFVQLDQLPLTPNGKVDRAALPALEHATGESAGHVEPQSPVQELLAGIWAEILKVPRVSVHDNFFELGGHSLLATQLVSRVREVFRLEVPLRLLFERPTVALLAESIETLLHDSQSVSTAPPIESVRRDGPLPLSFAQQRLWFIDQLESGSAFYNMPTALRLTGRLDLNALRQALGEIVRRHEILRTHFVTVEGEPAQRISEAREVSVVVTDLSELGERAAGEAERLAREEAQRPFELSRGPMLRVQVLRLGEEEHVVLLTMHHIISDAWSMSVLVKEVAALYSAFSGGQPSPLPELPVQYADYAAWQRTWLSGETLAQELSYWREQLGGELPVLELPTDHARPSVQSYRSGRFSFKLSEEVTSGLKELSRGHGATLFMTLLSAFQVLLMRYSSQEDVIVGTDIANRTRTELEPLIGFFINQLVMRTNLSGDPTFGELVGRVREVCLGAYAHQEVPFERLVEELQPERTLSHTPLFQVKFLLQNTPTESLEVSGLRLEALHSDSGAARFELTVALTEYEGRLLGSVQYNADLFERETIERLVGHFRALLAGIVSDPAQRVSRLPLLTAAERRQLLVQWNQTRRSYPREKCLHQLFEEQAERTPEAAAVVCEDEQVSYRELNERANRLAHYLRSLGVGPDVVVGVCLERSIEMVAALLGILKAGGAYLPLDPEYPLERLAWMLEDSNVPLLLTEERVEGRLPTHWGQTIYLDAEWETIAGQGAENPAGAAAAGNLAYVIYTSGSTGTPKGVMVAHRGLSNLVTAQSDFLGLGPGSRMLQFASVSFDAAAFEIFTALCN
ncbi:MAG TPA: condensation domain-containing protein, partial [Pyrinomonadaceae bacterium]